MQMTTTLPTKRNNLDDIARVLLDPVQYIETFLFVKNKDAQIVPLRLNPIQRRLARLETKRNIKLKGRQAGMSTWELAKRFYRLATTPNWTIVTVAHVDDVAEKLLETIKLFYECLPPEVKPIAGKNTSSELYFSELNSRYTVYTAKGFAPARGTTINDAHLSEAAWYDNPRKITNGLMQSITKDAYVDIESTANGAGGYFFNQYKESIAGDTSYKPFFFTWFDDPEYRFSDKQARTMNVDPDMALDDEEKKLVTVHGLTKQQINWRRWKKRELKDDFAQEYPEDDDSCFLISGRTYFDKASVKRAKLIGERQPVRVEDNGGLKVYAEPQLHRYIIGADVAEGLATGDYSTASVLDLSTGDEVATLHGHWNEHDFAVRLRDLSKRYNGALLGVERNNHGHAVLTTLIYELAYSQYLYFHQDYDQQGKITKKPGWITSSKTKPIALSTLQQALLDAPDTFHDGAFFGECNTFVYHDNGSIGAQDECHDDRVMARAIAQEIFKSFGQRHVAAPPTGAGDRPILNNYRTGY